MLLEIETLVLREVTLVSMVNCWCAEIVLVRGSEDVFLQGKYCDTGARKLCWCAGKTLVLLEIEWVVSRVVTLVSMVNCWCAEIVLVRGSVVVFKM